MSALAIATLALMASPKECVVYQGESGPGKGKHIVFLAGDEEYRSEEALPQLAKILAFRHGFKCTVVFSLNDKGEIDPTLQSNQPGIEALDTADLCVMLLRFRAWPDAQMKHFVDYYLAGKPIIALRTSTHAFNYPDSSSSPYRKYSWQSKEWPGGFGKQVLGETWISHWGNHGSQATCGAAFAKHPILNGVKDLFGTTDVYEAAPPADAEILARGQVLSGMEPTSPPMSSSKKTTAGVEQELNNPMMPIAWVRNYKNEAGKTNKIFTTTMGAATDLLSEGFRRMLVNGAYWGVGLRVPKSANVEIVGPYQPSTFGFGSFRKGMKPTDFEIRPD